jgi:hypothetical protein
VLSARGAQVRHTGITVNGHEQIEFRERRTQLRHGTADYEGVYVRAYTLSAAYPNSGGSQSHSLGDVCTTAHARIE